MMRFEVSVRVTCMSRISMDLRHMEELLERLLWGKTTVSAHEGASGQLSTTVITK